MARNFIAIQVNDASVRQTIQSLKKVDKDFEKAMVRLVETTAINIAKDTVKPTSFPFITGFLRGSYDADARQTQKTLSAVAYSVAEYAEAVEYGQEMGYHQQAQPFFRPAIELHEERFHKAVPILIEKHTK